MPEVDADQKKQEEEEKKKRDEQRAAATKRMEESTPTPTQEEIDNAVLATAKGEGVVKKTEAAPSASTYQTKTSQPPKSKE